MTPASFVVRAALSGAKGVAPPEPLPDSDAAWSRVLALAVEHRVAALLLESLAHVPQAKVPSAVQRALTAQLLRNSATRLLCESTLSTLVDALRANQVEVIVLKGASVAHTLYPRPELRLYHDIDLLCRVEDYPALYRTVLALGFTSAGTFDARGTHETLARRPSPSESHAVRAFYDSSGEIKVEVHFDLLQVGLRDRCEREYWLQSRTRNVNGVQLRLLMPEHQFVHLACHALRHSFTRLSWLLELELLARQPGLDWSKVSEVARAEGMGAGVRHALAVASMVFGAVEPPLPPPTLEERALRHCYQVLLSPARIGALLQHERRRLLLFLPDSAKLGGVLFGLVLMGRRHEKLHALWMRYDLHRTR